MEVVLSHLRNKLVAGLFAAVPIAIIVYAAIWIEAHTAGLAAPFGIQFPGLGVLIAIVGMYLLGLLVTSFLGQMVLRLANQFLERMPGLNLLYKAWKDLLVVPPNKAGMFHQVVLVPLDGNRSQIGFTSGQALPGDPASICVFLPNIPNPFSGRLMVMKRDVCIPMKLSTEEALKYQLSSGNYLPAELSGNSSHAVS